MVTRRRAFLVLMGFGLLAAGVRADQGLLGFSDERARAQRALEQRFDSLLKADDLREWMRRLSARPHHLGSPYDKENADLLASLFRSWGYDTRIEEFRVLFPTPKMRVLEMLEPTRFTASLVEPLLKKAATPEAKRLTLSEAPTLTKIPVMPIAYADAQPLLRALRGPVAPEAWRGALPLTYHLGPGPTKVHLKLAFNWNQVPAYDVIARLRGAERPDEWIVRGNHHDAWVNGANDPISGLVPLLAEAKAIGELHRRGWTPKRTLVFAAWDGEEPGLLGSTEWAEAHADELRQKAAVYINTDGNGRGFLGVGGSHTLERFINEVARDVVDPQTKVSVAERWRARLVMDAKPEDRKEARDRRDLRISALGSGSDFTPFLQHLGIASLNLGYGGARDRWG